MKIINIKDLRMRKAVSRAEGHLREFKEYYEFCFVDDYEMKYDDFKIDSVQVVDIFVSILENKGKFILVSVQFPKSYNVYAIVEWLDNHQVSFNQKDEQGFFIEEAHSVIETVLYKRMPIVIATRGTKKLYVDTTNLEDITEKYAYYSKIINTEQAKPVDIPEEVNKEKKKYSKAEMWIDDTDKDDWIDRWLDGDGYPGSDDERKGRKNRNGGT